ncbi:MAG TPA: type II secretion system protein [Pirellulaceae bacterium]|nr:type II secretion system protein [Pirellulaceae bacterium]
MIRRTFRPVRNAECGTRNCRHSALRTPRSALKRRAFTLIEAVIALVIMSLAGSVLLLAAHSSLRTTDEAVRRTIAEGLADQLLDEIVTRRYMEAGGVPNDGALGTEGGETAAGRSLFDDTDDYHNLVAKPAQGRYGESLGTGDDAGGPRHPNFQVPQGFFDNYRQRVRVYYVDPTAPDKPLPEGQTSYYRGALVAIDYVDPAGGEQELAVRRRVYAYIPPPP